MSHCPVADGVHVAPPAGWDTYFVMCPDTCYVNCLFGVDGYGLWYNDTRFVNGSNYAPALVGNKTVEFIRSALSDQKPFFAYVAPHSPHTPATPAPWYTHTFQGVRAPRTPAYGVPAPDFHWAVAVQPRLNLVVETQMDLIARHRLQTLLSVDDTVRAIAELLDTHGSSNNSFVVMTSDHGKCIMS